jgi:hypothetical protein
MEALAGACEAIARCRQRRTEASLGLSHVLHHVGNDSSLEASPGQTFRVSKHRTPQFESRNIDAMDIPSLGGLAKLEIIFFAGHSSLRMRAELQNLSSHLACCG